MKQLLILLVLVTINSNVVAASTESKHGRIDLIKEVFKYNNDSKRSIELSELTQGCSSVDCIPAIDNPKFGAIEDIEFIHDNDIMMLVNYNGIQKAYPRKIMQTHEIVNDYFGNKPVAMTYCPLCGTSVAFEPIIDGERVEFGVSGVLHNSDLVMYDRKTKSLWGQITGRSIVGPKTGDRLKTISASLMTWMQLKEKFPHSKILLPPTNKAEDYKDFHYQKYTQSEKIMFPVAIEDARLSSKQFVYGIEIDDSFIAFEEDNLIKNSPMVESYGKRILQVTYKDGKATAMDKKTGETFNALRVYWFAWFAFHPETILRN